MTPAIELAGLDVHLGSRKILDDLTCTLSGRTIGLLGPNGAGKSTLINTLLGFHKPTRGTARILGHDIQKDQDHIRSIIGFMPENDSFIAHMTAVAFVRMMGELSGLPAEAALERAHEVLFYVGLGEARYRNLGTYSLGMKQLAKLAQAIVHGPQLVILDEPTNGLDPPARQRMTRMIRENVIAIGGKAGKPGCTFNAAIIFIDQPLELVKAFAEEEPGYFGLTPKELAKFTAVQRPVTSWHVTDMRGRDGQELGQMGMLGGMPADARINRNAAASRLYTNVREDMLVGFVVIDRQQTVGKSLRQLADLATMHIMLDVRQDASELDPGSILSLFESRAEGDPVPDRLSQFDRGALRGFYTQRENNRSARQQAENIARAIEKGAGEEPPPAK